VWFVSLKRLVLGNNRSWWLSIVFLLVIVAPVEAAVKLRVAVTKNVQELAIGSSTTAVVKDDSGRKLGQIPPMSNTIVSEKNDKIVLQNLQVSSLIVEPSAGGYIWIGDRWYRGQLRLLLQDQGILAVNYVDLEEYLYSVVGGEAVPSWPLQALKAQAVAARSYALYKRSTAQSLPYELDTTDATQVYKGLASEYNTTHEAVDGTKGQIMTYQGEVILAVFHSGSGGHTENVEDVWSSSLPYLRGVVDYDFESPKYQWNESFSSNQLTDLFQEVGTVKEMVVEKTTPQGRVISMKVVGSNTTKSFTGDLLRKLLNLPSTLFLVTTTPEGFLISGKGFGHGLGLSQWGAYYLAKQGYSYQQILTHYYPNAKLSHFTPK